ncbi:hypothetical protein [Psychromonas hadalis]|uniref:hypothetical protein n=1 Tax=Psychromonas hadalis TaxID=211669 RepID=UPI0003B45AD9|nr:hypothetical protein [Psychromonas hadalis]
MCKYILLLFVFLSSKPFVIGRIGSNPVKNAQQLQEMADYIANKLKDDGFTSGKVISVKNYSELKKEIRAGNIDWVTDTGLVAAKLESEVLACAVLLTDVTQLRLALGAKPQLLLFVL